MFKKIFKVLIFFSLIFYLIFFLLNSTIWHNNLLLVLNLWLDKIVVGLIPMYIISSIIIGVPLFSNVLFKLIKRFNFFENSYALSIFLVSFLCGNPTTSILVNKAYENKMISLKQANHIIESSSHISFLFIILFFEKEISIILIISQIITTIIIYIFKKRKKEFVNDVTSFNLLNSVNNIIEDLPSILLKILSSMIIVTFLKIPFNNLNNNYLNIFLSYLEVTTGLNTFNSLNINPFIYIVLVSSILSLNGFSIILQVFNVLKKTRLSFKGFFIGRIVHMLLSASFSLVFYLILIFFF